MSQIKQSVAWWGFVDRAGMAAEQLVRVAADIGYQGVELVPPEYWSLVKQHGLTIVAISGHNPREGGFNWRELHERLERNLYAALAQAETWHIPNVIVTSGMREGRDDRTGAEITAEGLRRVVKAAEEVGVTIVMELLNSKVNHPDYQCDHTAWGVEVCRMVDSARIKLLYDIYHMQIMEGDITRTIRDYHAYFSHYHAAGNPGRGELDETQELYYPAIVRAILATGYQGYLGQEFIPQGNPTAALKQAFEVCNVSL